MNLRILFLLIISLPINLIFISCNKDKSTDKAAITVISVKVDRNNEFEIIYLITDNKGNPLPNKRIDFNVIDVIDFNFKEKDWGLNDKTNWVLNDKTKLTGHKGYVTLGGIIFSKSLGSSSLATINASVFGYNSKISMKLQCGNLNERNKPTESNNIDNGFIDVSRFIIGSNKPRIFILEKN